MFSLCCFYRSESLRWDPFCPCSSSAVTSTSEPSDVNLPHLVEITIQSCSASKGLRAEVFRICMLNDASYCDSVEDSFTWARRLTVCDLVVRVKTMDMWKAKKIKEGVTELASARGCKANLTSLEICPPYKQNWVDIQDFKSSGISPEYSPTPSVHSTKECSLSAETQLRMVEDPKKSYIKVGLIVQKCHLAPRYKYKRYANDPMNIVYLTHNLHFPLDNSEIRVCDGGRSVAVPKICFSLAKDEFPGLYSNEVKTTPLCGRTIAVTEVFLAVVFRVHDEEYLVAVLDLLKPTSTRAGNKLVTSVLIRHEDESVDDFEDFVRENKIYTHNLWQKAPGFTMDGRDEYELQEEDLAEIQDIEGSPQGIKRKRTSV
mmetsp:Transcript_118696/g.233035  ORF Transcript_118696/g.233035 Transcript_118696/m.233035 type:complete len:373 (+) Transcript_118696:203-1321(+)